MKLFLFINLLKLKVIFTINYVFIFFINKKLCKVKCKQIFQKFNFRNYLIFSPQAKIQLFLIKIVLLKGKKDKINRFNEIKENAKSF